MAQCIKTKLAENNDMSFTLSTDLLMLVKVMLHVSL